MKLTFTLIILLLSSFTYCAKIDFMEYFLQDKDISDNYTIGGNQTHVVPSDPELNNPKDIQIIVYNKFNSVDYYEIFRLSGNNLMIRYEVFRNSAGTDSWVRVFENIGANPEDKLGYLWSKRYIDPDTKEGWEYEVRQNKFIFNSNTKEYEYDKSGSIITGYKQYSFVTWGTLENPKNNHTGKEIKKVLRLVSEWQPLGIIYETYDYAKGLGLVDWCWYEQVASFKQTPENNVYQYSLGYMYVESFGDENVAPIVYKYDIEKKEQTEKLRTVKHKSHWNKDGKEDWYIRARCLSDEGKIERKKLKIIPNFNLPEWGHDKTLKDL